MPQAAFSISLSPEKVVLFYKGTKNRVQVTADDGTTLSIPWALFQPYVSKNGIRGRFTIVFDAQGKCTELRAVG